MKIIKLSGGLGNQMFQYAFGVALRHAGNEVLYDNFWYDEINKSKKERATKRNYELAVFQANVPLADAKQIKKCRREHFLGIRLFGFLRRLSSRVVKARISRNYQSELLSLKNDAYLIGVFANNTYFDDYRQELIHDFSLKEEMSAANLDMLNKIKETNSVSLHIRRGDYVKLGITCNLNYYYKAIDYICSQTENPHFYIFSDDVNWVRDNLKISHPHTFVDINDGKTGYFDMELMKNCRHNITANSTFSWWAAYLNQNPQKIALAPKDKDDDAFRLLFKGGYS